MLIKSQDKRKMCIFDSMTIVRPEKSSDDDGIYRVYVNGSRYGEYPTWYQCQRIMQEIDNCIHNNKTSYEMPEVTYAKEL